MLHAQKLNNRLITVVISPSAEDYPEPPSNVPLPPGAEWVLVSDDTPPESVWDGAQWVPPYIAPQPLSRLEFMRRIPTEKRIAIRSAAKSDPVIEDFLDLLSAATEVHRDNPDTLAGLTYLVNQGLLTQADVDIALAT